jgi:hypothetical protein
MIPGGIMTTTTDPRIDQYLDTREPAARLAILKDLHADGIELPLNLVEDLLTFNLDHTEKSAIIGLLSCNPSLDAEDFLTSQIPFWPQELSVPALQVWAHKTARDLWFRLIPLISIPTLPQRVRYTLLDISNAGDSRRVVQTLLDSPGWQDLSPAFHALLLEKCIAHHIKHPRATELANQVVANQHGIAFASDKTFPFAVIYLSIFHPEFSDTICTDPATSLAAQSIVASLTQSTQNGKRLLAKFDKVVYSDTRKKIITRLWQAWPEPHLRHQVETETLAEALRIAFSPTIEKDANTSTIQGFFAANLTKMLSGFRQETLHDCLYLLQDKPAVFAACLPRILPYLHRPLDVKISDAFIACKDHFPRKDLLVLPPLLRRISGAEPEFPESLYLALESAEKRAIDNAELSAFNTSFALLRLDHYPTASAPGSDEDNSRRNFLNVSIRRKPPQHDSQSRAFWDQLTEAWLNPREKILAPLATASRAAPKIFQQCYIQTLGRFAGMDEAALKILDFMRSDDESTLRAAIYALGGIGTTRAAQELINAMTRPNATLSLQLEICGILKEKNLADLQPELRSTYADLVANFSVRDEQFMALRDGLSALITPVAASTASSSAGPRSTAETRPEMDDTIARDLDKKLMNKIPYYRELSAEVRRSLRTAQFFDDIVPKNATAGSIDVSPVIDMQYKSLELLFRESFEEAASRKIEIGMLQHKLDVIGYARPIPVAMDEFEAYIEKLPVISSIPFFSKFKLRKMLRAICQFRPGRRFTLDGLKAFALFFLCFSRSECKYGLANLFDAGFESDQKLFEFCNLLHVFQDARNRAAHEGFHPEARNDIHGIWQTTAEIVQTVYEIKSRMRLQDGASNSGRRGATDANKISVIKKVS